MAKKIKTSTSPQAEPAAQPAEAQPAPTPDQASPRRLANLRSLPPDALGNMGGNGRQLLQLQRAVGNHAMSRLMAPPGPPLAPAPEPPANGQAVGDAAAPLIEGGLAAPAAGVQPPAANGAPSLLPPASLAGRNGSQMDESGQIVERPPTSPIAQATALENAQIQTQRVAESGEPEFAQSVEVAPTAEIEEIPAEGPAGPEAAQAAEPEVAEQQTEEATGQLEETSEALTDESPVPEEVAAAGGEAEEAGAAAPGEGETPPKSADLTAVAGQATALLATPMADTAVLASQPVTFAPTAAEQVKEPTEAAQARQRRGASEALATAFLARNASHAQNFLALGLTIPPRILMAATLAKAGIDAAVAQNIGTVTAQIAAVRAQVIGEAATAIESIAAQRDTVLAAITEATVGAQAEIETAYTDVTSTLDTLESDQISSIEELYTTWDPKFREVGTQVGDEAVATAQTKANNWLDQRNGESDILDGPIHDNRLEAKADAALKVAEEYKKSLEQAANEQAEQVQQGKTEVLETVRGKAQEARTAIDTHLQTMLDSLAQSEESALAQAEETANRLIQSVESSQATTLAALAEQEVSQINRLIEYGERQKGAIDADAAQSITSLVTGVDEAVTAFNEALHGFLTNALATEAPDQAALQSILAEIQMQTDTLAATMLQQLTGGIQASEEGLLNGSNQSVEAVNSLGQSAVEQADSTGAGYSESITALLEQATSGFNQLQEGQINTATEAAASAVEGFETTSSNLEETFSVISENVESNFENGRTQLQTGLRQEGLKDLDSTIETEAKKAADAVQPRWKSVVKWVITIVVVIAVIAITIVTAGAGGVLGGILIGAALGGVAGATIQVGHNLVDGKKWSDGVVQAAVVGAIGGAFGGAGGALGKAVFGEVAKGVLNTGLKIGLEVGMDVVGGAVGDLVTTGTVNWGNVLLGAAIGAGVGGGLAIGGALKGKIKIKPNVDVSAPKVQAPEVAPPKAPAPEAAPPPKAPAPEPTPPKAPTPEAPPAPKAPAPEAAPPPKAPAPEPTPPKAPPPEAPPAPKAPAPEAAPPPKAQAPEAAPPTKRKTHLDEPEIEDGIVAKHKMADGHEMKVTKDGQLAKCTVCEPLRLKYADELAADPKLKQRLDDIEAISDPKLKAKAGAEFDAEMSQAQAAKEAAPTAPPPKRTEAEWRERIDNPPPGKTADDVRYERHQQNSSEAGRDPMPRDKWDKAKETLDENRQRGRVNEDSALQSGGIDNNNYARDPSGKPRDVIQYEVDGVTVRPDGITKTKVVDVKSVNEGTVYYTEQLRAQKKGAVTGAVDGNKRDLAVVIANDKPDLVRPSGPLADNATVVHHNSQTGVWSRWDPRANNGLGGWKGISDSDAKTLLGSS